MSNAKHIEGQSGSRADSGWPFLINFHMESVMDTTKARLWEQINYVKKQAEEEPQTLIDESLEMSFIFNFSRKVIGVELLICCGGPTIRLNSRWGKITGFWGSERIEDLYRSEELDCILLEYAEMIIGGE